jgi:putative transposase
MPDHIHLLLSLPAGDSDFPKRIMLIKSGFTRRYLKGRPALHNFQRVDRRERTVWQSRFWEHQIADQRAFDEIADYIHYNPVAHGLVTTPIEWPSSSFHQWVRDGRRDECWGKNAAPTLVMPKGDL